MKENFDNKELNQELIDLDAEYEKKHQEYIKILENREGPATEQFKQLFELGKILVEIKKKQKELKSRTSQFESVSEPTPNSLELEEPAENLPQPPEPVAAQPSPSEPEEVTPAPAESEPEPEPASEAANPAEPEPTPPSSSTSEPKEPEAPDFRRAGETDPDTSVEEPSQRKTEEELSEPRPRAGLLTSIRERARAVRENRSSRKERSEKEEPQADRREIEERFKGRFGQEMREAIENLRTLEFDDEKIEELILEYFQEQQNTRDKAEIVRISEQNRNWQSLIQDRIKNKKVTNILTAAIGSVLGITGSIVARAGVNIVLNTTPVLAAAVSGGIIGAHKEYKKQREELADADKLLADLKDEKLGLRLWNSANIVQTINQAIESGLHGNLTAVDKLLKIRDEAQKRLAIDSGMQDMIKTVARRVKEEEQGYDEVLKSQDILANFTQILEAENQIEESGRIEAAEFRYQRLGTRWERFKRYGWASIKQAGMSLAFYEAFFLISEHTGIGEWLKEHLIHQGAGDNQPSTEAPGAPAHLHSAPPETEPIPPATTTPESSVPAPESPPEPAPQSPELSTEEVETPTHLSDERMAETLRDEKFRLLVEDFEVGENHQAAGILIAHHIDPQAVMNQETGANVLQTMNQFLNDPVVNNFSPEERAKAVYHLLSHPQLFELWQDNQIDTNVLTEDWPTIRENLDKLAGFSDAEEIGKRMERVLVDPKNVDNWPNYWAENSVKMGELAAETVATVSNAGAAEAPTSGPDQPPSGEPITSPPVDNFKDGTVVDSPSPNPAETERHPSNLKPPGPQANNDLMTPGVRAAILLLGIVGAAGATGYFLNRLSNSSGKKEEREKSADEPVKEKPKVEVQEVQETLSEEVKDVLSEITKSLTEKQLEVKTKFLSVGNLTVSANKTVELNLSEDYQDLDLARSDQARLTFTESELTNQIEISDELVSVKSGDDSYYGFKTNFPGLIIVDPESQNDVLTAKPQLNRSGIEYLLFYQP